MQNTVQLCCTETEMWFVGSLSVFLSSHQRISWMWRSRQVSSYLSNLTVTLLPCKRPLLTFVSSWVRRRKGRSTWTSSSVWRRQIPNFLTTQSCFLLSNWFSEFDHRFIELNPLYQANGYIRPGFGTVSQQHTAQCMLNEDLTRFIYSLSRERQNRASKRKTLLALRYFAGLTFRRRLC